MSPRFADTVAAARPGLLPRRATEWLAQGGVPETSLWAVDLSPGAAARNQLGRGVSDLPDRLTLWRRSALGTFSVRRARKPIPSRQDLMGTAPDSIDAW